MHELEPIDTKKAELLSLTISQEDKRRLEKKFRLEWNYHSNHMEGNTLSYGETQMLLFFGKATGDHAKRDYDEMQAHDVAMKMVEEWARDKERDITEADIRELNKIILVSPFWKEAITQDGKATQKEIVPGTYKTSPNSVRLKNGEIHEYASPQETPILMKKLMDSYYGDKEQHPLIKAARFHHRFTAIHPFDDGNGRVARLLTNFMLIREGYPPVVIKTENKEEYLTALQKADAGDLIPFILFVIKELNWSMDISIKAAKGEPIDEPSDIDKQIDVLKKRLEGRDVLSTSKSKQSIDLVMVDGIFPLLEKFESKCERLLELFMGFDRIMNYNIGGTPKALGGNESDVQQLKDNFRFHLSREDAQSLHSIEYRYTLKGFKKSLDRQYMSASLQINFSEFSYSLQVNIGTTHKMYAYNNPLSEAEQNAVVKSMMDYILEDISKASGLQ